MTDTKQRGKTISTSYMEKLLSGGMADQDCLNWLLRLDTLDTRKVLEIGLKQEEYTHLYDVIPGLMTEAQRIEWAVYCAERCLRATEEYPDIHDTLRKVINAARWAVDHPCRETREAVGLAAKAITRGVYTAAPATSSQCAANAACVVGELAYVVRNSEHVSTCAYMSAHTVCAVLTTYNHGVILREGYKILTAPPLSKVAQKRSTTKVLTDSEAVERAHKAGFESRNANMRCAKLEGANLSEVDITKPVLKAEYVGEAYLQRTHLRWANLKGANLRFRGLLGATQDH